MSMLRKFKKNKQHIDFLRQEKQFMYGHRDSLIYWKSMYLLRSSYVVGTVVNDWQEVVMF